MNIQKKIENLEKELKELKDSLLNPVIMEIKASKVEWGKSSSEEMTWDEAKEWCDNQGKGWRLPTRIELLEAYEQKIGGFKNHYYWSSTTYPSRTSSAFIVYFGSGYSNDIDKTNNYYVRCVR